jgi:hypothetical protein
MGWKAERRASGVSRRQGQAIRFEKQDVEEHQPDRALPRCPGRGRVRQKDISRVWEQVREEILEHYSWRPAQSPGQKHDILPGRASRLLASFVSNRVRRYEGEMVGGKYHGRGKLTYADGRKYDGTWHEGVMHGKGTFRFANGDGEHCALLQNQALCRCTRGKFLCNSSHGLASHACFPSLPSPPLHPCALPDLPDPSPPPHSLRRGVFWRETAGTRQACVDEWGCL